MSLMQVELEGGGASFRPGDAIKGSAAWDLPGPPTGVEVRLVFRAHGANGSDEGVAASLPLPGPRSRDRRPFALVAPDGPYSYAGQLFSIDWAVEVLALPDEQRGRAEIVIGPGGEALAGRG